MAIPVETPSANAAAFVAMRAAIGVPQANLAASAAPTVNDDTTQGYGAGSYWRWASTGREWVCISASTGAAVWQPVTASYKLPSGRSIHCDNVNNVNGTGIGTSPTRTYSPITLGGFGTFSWEVLLTTLAAGAEMRVAVYDCDSSGLPGKQVVAPVVIDLSAGSGTAKSAALSWTPTRLGRWWIMQHVKAANPQAVLPRIGSSPPGIIPATSANHVASAANPLRYLTSAEAYGSDPADATGLTSAANGSDCPVGWLLAA